MKEQIPLYIFLSICVICYTIATIMGLMMREAGVQMNGKLRAMKLKIEDEKGRAA